MLFRSGAALVGLMVGLTGGLTDLDALWRSQIPTIGPAWLARAEVAVALGLGLGVAVGAIVALARERSRRSVPVERAGRVAGLVAGLDDRELRRIAAGLDVDVTLGGLMAELAVRCAPDVPLLAAAPVRWEVVAADADAPRLWRLAVADGAVVAAPEAADRGAEVSGVRVRVSFPTFLRLVAGVVTLDGAVGDGRAEVSGPSEVTVRLAARLPEVPASPDR